MQSTHLKSYGASPFFVIAMATETPKNDKVSFFRTEKRSATEEIKIFFNAAKIFLVHMKNRQQKRIDVRLRTPQTSLIGETNRLLGLL